MNQLLNRIGAGVEISWSFNLKDQGSVRQWVIAGHAEIIRKHHGRNVFWPHAWVRLFGLLLGAGFCFVEISE